MEEGAGRLPGLVGRSPAIERVGAKVERLAPSSAPVHVVGETGTGKELVARALHARSRRARAAFVPVNAASLGEELLEATLFGHARGAFTGAVADRQGLVAAADGGTLFLDEVADLSPRAQAKLLRFLQDGEYCRLGEVRPRRADVRVVSATNVSLSERVAAARFRRDLDFRLRVFELALPPLRERAGDVRLLARHLATRLAGEEARPLPRLDETLLRRLETYDWPGNVRELETVMRRIVLGEPDGLPEAGCARPRRLCEARDGLERQLVERALSDAGGCRAEAARRLGISRQGLWLKRRRLGL